MSLEQTLNENTIAIRDLIAVLKMQGYALASQPAEIPGFDTVTSASTGATEQDPVPAKPVSGETYTNEQMLKDAVEVANAANPEPKTKAKPKAEPKVEQTAPAAEVSYADAAAAVTKLSRLKGRDAAVSLLSSFGAAKLPEVPAERYADVVRQVEMVLSQSEAA